MLSRVLPLLPFDYGVREELLLPLSYAAPTIKSIYARSCELLFLACASEVWFHLTPEVYQNKIKEKVVLVFI